MFKVIILPLAKEDIKTSANWYNEQQKGLGNKFTNQIRQEIQFVLQNPVATVTRYDEVKTCVVKSFPFMIHTLLHPSVARLQLGSAFMNSSKVL